MAIFLDSQISGSATSTGSFGRVVIDTNISESSPLTVDGTSGRLFSVTDQMSGSIFSANLISGLPVIEAFSDNKVNIGPFSSPIQIDSSGNISGSSTSTGSFGRGEIAGNFEAQGRVRGTRLDINTGNRFFSFNGSNISILSSGETSVTSGATNVVVGRLALGSTYSNIDVGRHSFANSGYIMSVHQSGTKDIIQLYNPGSQVLSRFDVSGSLFLNYGDVSGSSTSTGSFGHIKVGDNFTFNPSTTPVLTITGTRNDILFLESDTTNLNTLVRHQSGLFRIDTINDALDTVSLRFQIDHSTGNVSIGSAEDAAKFLQFRRGGSSTGTVRGSIGTNNSKLTFIGGSGTSAQMTLDSSGQLGIGTTSPNTLLEVAGTSAIRSTYTGTSSAGVGGTLQLVQDDGAAIESGHRLGVIVFGASEDASNTIHFGAGISAFATQLHSATQNGTKLAFEVTADGATSRTTAMTIFDDGNVGIGISLADGRLHVSNGLAGSVTAHANADELIVENSTHGGISILTPDSTNSNIYFGSPSDNKGAEIVYGKNDGIFLIGTSRPGHIIKFRSADQTDAMVIDASQNVGIGNTSPSTKLTVAGTVSASNGDGGLELKPSSRDAILTYTDRGTDRWNIWNDQDLSGVNNVLRFDTSLGSSKMVIKQSGEVGIGDTSPTEGKLVVAGTGGASSPALHLEITDSNTFNHFANMRNSNLTAGENGIIIFGKALNTKNAAWIGFKYNSDGGDDNQLSLGFWSANNLVNLLPNGNLGIGTESPGRELHIGDGTGTPHIFMDGTNTGTNTAANGHIAAGIILKNNSATNGGFNAIDGYNSNGLVDSRIAFIHDNISSRHGEIGFLVHNGSALTERVRLDKDGNVGIGTTSPGEKLELKSSSDTDKTRLKIVGGTKGFTLGKTGQAQSYAHLRPMSDGQIMALRLMPHTSDNDTYLEIWGHDYETDTTNFARGMLVLKQSDGNAFQIISDGNGSESVGDIEFIIENGSEPSLSVNSTKISGSASTTGSFGQGYFDGRVGIGAENPDVSATALDQLVVGYPGVGGASTGTNHAGIVIGTGNTHVGRISFLDTPGSYGGAIDYHHAAGAGGVDVLGFFTDGFTRRLVLEGNKISGSSTSTGSFGSVHISDRLGIGTTNTSEEVVAYPDQDIKAVFGRVALHSVSSDYATFSHYDHRSSGVNYALRQTANAATAVNAASGQRVNFNINNSTKMVVSGDNVGIGTTSPGQKLDIRGNNSAGTFIQIRDTGDDYPVGVTYNHAVSGHHYSWYAGTMDGASGERKFTISAGVIDGFNNTLTNGTLSILTLNQSNRSTTLTGDLNVSSSVVFTHSGDKKLKFGSNVNDGGVKVTNAVMTVGDIEGSDAVQEITSTVFGGNKYLKITEDGVGIDKTATHPLDVSGTTRTDNIIVTNAITPVSTLVLQSSAASSGQDVNNSSRDIYWNTMSTENTTHVDWTAGSNGYYIRFVTAGEYMVYVDLIVTDATANDRMNFFGWIAHMNSSNSIYYSYPLGGSYIRDDSASYDSGGVGGNARLIVAANDRVKVRTQRFDSQDPTDDNPLDTTLSRIRIEKITYGTTA